MRSIVALLGAFLFSAPSLVAGQSALPGNTLISPLNSNQSFLIDLDENVLKIWTGANLPTEFAYLLPDDSVMRPCRDPNGQFPFGGAGGHLQRIDTNDVVVWEYFFSNDQHQQHHDVQVMPNGNVLLIAWELKTMQEAIDAGREAITGDFWPTMIVELEPVGSNDANVVWEWHLWDHLIQDVDPGKPNYGVVADHPERIDINHGDTTSRSWDHANSIDYDPIRDEIVFSARGMNEFYIIDHSTTTEEAAGSTGGNRGKGGDILYRWGNPQAYDRGGPGQQYYFGVHGANFVDVGLPGAGSILTFNNGNRAGTLDDYSSVETIVPPRDAFGNYFIESGQPFGPSAPSWRYQNDPALYAPFRGGAFRLANGNTLVCDADNGILTEVTLSGQIVWLYQAPAAIHRAPRYWNPAATSTPPIDSSKSFANYPNPFNPRTTIRFLLPTDGFADLSVYDIQGRLVRRLIHGPRSAGINSAIWDGRDGAGKPVASGVFFYQLRVGDQELRKKMTVLR